MDRCDFPPRPSSQSCHSNIPRRGPRAPPIPWTAASYSIPAHIRSPHGRRARRRRGSSARVDATSPSARALFATRDAPARPSPLLVRLRRNACVTGEWPFTEAASMELKRLSRVLESSNSTLSSVCGVPSSRDVEITHSPHSFLTRRAPVSASRTQGRERR